MKRDLIFLIDRSLSVYGSKKNILRFYRKIINSYSEDDLLITICLFSDRSETLCLRQPPEVTASILEKEYYNDGSSAIFDSLCSFIEDWDRYIQLTSASKTEAQLFIITDKVDNASTANTYDDAVSKINIKLEHNWQMKLYDMQFNEFQIEDFNVKGEKAWKPALKEDVSFVWKS